MIPFLKQIAGHYFTLGDIDRRCFVLPNRRAMVFFRQYLGEYVREGGNAIVCPQMYTIDDFFQKIGRKSRADRVQLLIELYNCYSSLKKNPEPIDEFISWGETILSDFNDIDKYLVDARSILMNVLEFRQMQSPLDYMTESQLEAMRRFASNFDELRGTKQEFLRNWEILYPLYESFDKALDAKGLSYDGKNYRSVAERLDTESVSDMLDSVFDNVTGYVFVGLNALNECEKKLIGRMVTAGLAECCWDFSSAMIRDEANKSSHFLSDNIARFGQAFVPDAEPLPHTSFNVVSVPSSTGQAKQLPEIFRQICPDGSLSINTAVVLPDEDLLVPVLNSIPESVSSVNVTMGYPMSGSQLYALTRDLAALQLSLREKNGEILFYHKPVWSILSNSIIRTLTSGETGEAIDKIRAERKYYVTAGALGLSPLMSAIFRKAGPGSASYLEYMKSVIAIAGGQMNEQGGMELEMDFAMEYYKSLLRLENYGLELKPQTWFRLVDQLVGRMSVPFKGEPLSGLQIMGPLETRAIDFDNVIILSCNEGLFPRHSVASSFIPAELRRGFGLPTYEYQDSVWAYYFYRMIQRASNVWMLFDSRAEMSRSGEESRYIKQLELHFNAPVTRYVVKAPVAPKVEMPPIQKTAEHIEKIKEICFSASALQDYLSCPAKFFYKKVEGLKDRDEISESLDLGMLGNVFHETMETLYRAGGEKLGTAYLKGLLKDTERIRSVVADRIMEKLGASEVEGRNIIYEDMVCRYVSKTISSDLELMHEHGVDTIDILGLELPIFDEINGFKFVGFIDRLDSIEPGTVRIVDYKTGKVLDQDLDINADNAEDIIACIFGSDDSKRPKIALQLYLYDTFLRHDSKMARVISGRRLVNSIYQTRRLFIEGVREVELCPEFIELMDERIAELLDEIASPQHSFIRTMNDKTCDICNFKAICGK